MKFLAYKKLTPKLRAAISDFLGSENAERFMLRNPGVKFIGDMPAHYVVLEERKDNKKTLMEVLAYGEADFIDENGELEVELCINEGSNPEKDLILLSGIKNLAEQRNLIVVVRSVSSKDNSLLRAGFNLCGADYLMQYSGVEKEIEKNTELMSGCGKIILKKELIDDAVLFSLVSDDHKTCFSSCIVYEYLSSVCITEVFTEEAFRRKGFGTKLIKKIIEAYSADDEKNHKKIVLHVSGENEVAVSLYKKLGFLVKESIFTYKAV